MLEHTNEIAIKILSEEHWDYRVKPENRWHYDTQYKMLVKAIELSKLSQHDVSKRKFAVEWMRNVNYGIGSGTEYFNAETREEALKLFWNGKNKEAFEINTIYVC